MYRIISYIIILAAGSAFGQGARLVKDINTITPGGTYPQHFVVMNDTLYFTGFAAAGHTLWKSDGTAGGTKPLNLGVSHVYGPVVSLNGKLIFIGSTEEHGSELWCSDGSLQGAYLVKDIRPGQSSSSPSRLTVHNGKVYFRASTPQYGEELWATDGTEAGTYMLKDITSGTSGSNVGSLTSAGSYLFFNAAPDPNNPNLQLWRSDGTEAGTVRVNNSIGEAFHMRAFNGNLYFTYDSKFYKTDGTSAGTQVIYNTNAFSTASASGKLFFWADSTLYKSDGTAGGTSAVGVIPGLSYVTYPTEMGGMLYFVIRTKSPTRYELWKTDGTASVTVKVKLLSEGYGVEGPTLLLESGNTLYFFEGNNPTGKELWRSDGTETGTYMVKDVVPGNNPGPRSAIAYKGNIYYEANDAMHGSEIWKSDGTAGGTNILSDLNVGAGGSGRPFPVNNKVFFEGFDGGNYYGKKLFVSDGSSSGTGFLKWFEWIPNQSAGGQLEEFASFRNKLFFQGGIPESGAEIWVSDGTVAGTKILKDISPGSGGSNPKSFTEHNGELYFEIDSERLWKTDGTPEGTKEVAPRVTGRYYNFLFVLNNILYAAEWESSSTKIYKVNSSSVTHVFTVPFEKFDKNGIFIWDNKIVVGGSTTGEGSELWITDLTSAGTYRVKDINPGAGSSVPRNFSVTSGKLYFTADDGVHGRELWVSDGTDAGTYMVKDVDPKNHLPGYNNSVPKLIVFNGKIYYTANNRQDGTELWCSDGTSSGTSQLKDIYPGSIGSLPGNLTLFDNKLFFTASDVAHGQELWYTDGTSQGTKLAADIEAGYVSSSPHHLVPVGNNLFFTAATRQGGWELYAYSKCIGLNLDATASTFCPGSVIQFREISGGGNIASRTYAFGDGTTTSSENPVKTFNAGSHNIILTAVSDSGCSDTINYTLLIHPKPQTSSVFGNQVSSILAQENYWVTGLNSSTYNWTITGGTLNTGQGNDTIQLRWGIDTAGYVNVTEISYPGCVGDPVQQKVKLKLLSVLRTSGSYAPKVFPNPSSGNITLQLPAEGIYQVRLYNSAGTLVFRSEQAAAASQSHNLEFLPKGVYLMSVEGGKDPYRQTIILE